MKILLAICVFALCAGTINALQAETSLLSSQQMPPQALSAIQARTVLSAYLLAPDKMLAMPPTLNTDDKDHLSYVFSGSGGGTYTIDAATLEKHISYAGLSAIDASAQTSQSHLSASALLQIASAYIAQHFPHYVSGMFQVNAPPVDVSSDGDEYYARFDTITASGAHLPAHATVIVEEDTGKVKAYDEYCLPTTISTTPAISQNQAVQIGQNWIVQNESTDPVAGQFQTDLGGASPIEFSVAVDPLLSQILVYEISYMTTVLTIDAQTGEVINQDFYGGGTPKLRSGPGKNPKDRETLYAVRLTTQGDRLNHGAIWTQDQTYVWSGYFPQAGIQVSCKAATVILSRGTQSMTLNLATEAKSNNQTAWLRRGTLYIPLKAVQALTPTFIKPSGFGGLLLNLPMRSQKH